MYARSYQQLAKRPCAQTGNVQKLHTQTRMLIRDVHKAARSKAHRRNALRALRCALKARNPAHAARTLSCTLEPARILAPLARALSCTLKLCTCASPHGSVKPKVFEWMVSVAWHASRSQFFCHSPHVPCCHATHVSFCKTCLRVSLQMPCYKLYQIRLLTFVFLFLSTSL